MSAPRNHYQPRFLLRGFASRLQGDAAFVWVHRKDAPPFESNIDNVASERHFHGTGNELEKDMSRAETEHAKLLQQVIASGRVSNGQRRPVGQMFSNMIVRTRNFRLGLQNVLISSLESLGTEVAMSRMLSLVGKLPREELEDQLEATFGISPNSPFGAMLLRLVQQSLADGSGMWAARTVIEHQTRAAQHPGAMATSHIKSLEKSLAPEVRAERYAELDWQLVSYPDREQALILGDLGPLAQYPSKGDSIVSPVYESEIPSLLCLPVARSFALVGTAPSWPIPTLEEINAASSELSLEYFVASQDTALERALHSRIGLRTRPFTKDELGQFLGDAFNDLERNPRL